MKERRTERKKFAKKKEERQYMEEEIAIKKDKRDWAVKRSVKADGEREQK